METVLIVIRIFFCSFLKQQQQQQVLSWGADEATDTEDKVVNLSCVLCE